MAAHAKKDSFIEVWRGIAVFLVVYYHYVDRLPPSAYGLTHGASLPFYSGKMGVLIFFIISGFLIAKSLNYSKSLADFYAKRLTRLWPLFIAASVLIFASTQIFPPPVVESGAKEFYNEQRTLSDLLGTIFFLKDFGFEWVDGVFWSILVELKFYLFIGILAALFPKKFVTVFASLAFGISFFQLALELFVGEAAAPVVRMMNGVLIAQYLPYFAIGTLLYKRDNSPLLTINIGMLIALAAIKIVANPNMELHGTVVFIMALTGLLAVDGLLFGQRLFVFLGKYSYSWYLFHQMIGVTIIAAVAPVHGLDAAVIAALACTLSIAMIMSQLFEWRFSTLAYDGLYRVFKKLGLDKRPVGAGAEGVQTGG